jgi:geranylgeranyl reductase family protein
VTRDRCDVLVVGGGPAGSSCAFGLRDAGLDVVVVDRAHFPRDKVCAGWVTTPVLTALAVDPVDYAKDRVMQPIRGFRVGRLGDGEVVAHRGEIVSWGIRRCEFDQYLLARAGARVRAGEAVREIRREGDRFVVNDAVEAPVLVGAGGHFCPVARWCGAQPGARERAVVAKEIEFRMDARQQELCPTLPEVPELLFTEDLEGYGWIVRKGDYLNVGLGRQRAEDFPAHVEHFLARLEALDRLPPGVPRRLAGHAYLIQDRSTRPLEARGALLVGDAAGLAHPRSGEGIRPAVESGLLAARVIRGEAGSARGRSGAYARAIEARFGRRTGRPGRGLTDLLPEAWKGPVSARVLANRWFASRVVVDRWFLHRHASPLLPG